MSFATHAPEIRLVPCTLGKARLNAFAEYHEVLRNGAPVLIRPLRADDRQLETDFIRNLSPETRRQRFLCDFKQPSEALIDQMMDVDHDRRLAFIALVRVEGELREIGVARYCATLDEGACECAITVADAWQHLGLGVLLMRHLIDEAERHGFRHMVSIDAASNLAMRRLASTLGFQCRLDPEDPSQVIHTLELPMPSP
ncbi:GNAT family N-acetyltransferase [Dyella amyloliquefaciens]|uniref:GNAT family N-acetyltransferase n=1 Tax=Dyella amyloliquefaciens TaxID=1770545 RepID=UPI00102E87F0|nr:GNAT family N-acetyltransferase [Dyella amyloliquefaciens]